MNSLAIPRWLDVVAVGFGGLAGALAAVPGRIASFVMRTLELPVLVSALVAVTVVTTVRMSSWSLNCQTGGRAGRAATGTLGSDERAP